MRLGLCCTFKNEDIRFRTTTERYLGQLSPAHREDKLRALAAHNAHALQAAIAYCARHGIGCFRMTSQILPLKTHPRLGYDTSLLGEEIVALFRAAGRLARRRKIRTTFHPDQFVVLSSPKDRVVSNALAEIEYQAEVAEWIGADVINVHGGGGYDDKRKALKRLVDNVAHLSPRARARLTIENDDRVYTPTDLLPVCTRLSIPLVYDVHHHRCNGDDLDEARATHLAVRTWNREPLFHISSPREGWGGSNPRSHADEVDIEDLPTCWDELDCTVEVEAKAKEQAVLELKRALESRREETAKRVEGPACLPSSERPRPPDAGSSRADLEGKCTDAS
jgi:UV DNA damage endonuclease